MSREEGLKFEACPPPNKRSALERRRRKRITVSCNRLRNLLPAFDGRQNDMASILEMTVEYLQRAQDHLPKQQQSSSPRLPASAEQPSGPNETLPPASATQPIQGGGVSESSQNTPIPIRVFQQSIAVQACPEVMEVVTVEPRIVAAEGTNLLQADPGEMPFGAMADGECAILLRNVSGPAVLSKPPEEPIALQRKVEDSSPLLSSTSQCWLPQLSVPSGPPSEKDFLADVFRSVPPSGPNWSGSAPQPQEEMLQAEVTLWEDDTEFQLEEVETTSPSGADGALLQPGLVPWLSEQEMLLPELGPDAMPGSPMLLEDQPGAVWDSKSGLQYLTVLEMETGFLKMSGLLALDEEPEP